MEMLYGAVAMGGNIRVGMEDNVMYAKGHVFLTGHGPFFSSRTLRPNLTL